MLVQVQKEDTRVVIEGKKDNKYVRVRGGHGPEANGKRSPISRREKEM